jgi:tetratricopeptide (TPR) repeat protein
VIFLSQHFHQIDHFEFFDISVSVDAKDVKNAYFAFSKNYHPDAIALLDLGEFKSAMEQVFHYGQKIYDLFMADSNFLSCYARVVQRRDEEFNRSLEAQRHQANIDDMPKIKTVVGLHGIKVEKVESEPSFSGPIYSPSPQMSKEAQEELDARKEKLKARLNTNLQAVKINPNSHVIQSSSAIPQANQVFVAQTEQQRKEQAKDFFFQGDQSKGRNQWLRAYNQYKLAVEYDPQNQKYKEALEQAKIKINQEKALEIWQKADEFIEIGLLDRALPLVNEALVLYTDDTLVLKFVEAFKEYDQSACIQALEQRIIQSPYHLDLYWQLGQLYLQKNQITQARQQFEKMLSFDPSEPRALKMLKKG